jgi:pre-60S factor REI1
LGYSLVLPSGVTLGHRALMRYYKQRLNPNPQLSASENAKRLQQNQLKALGWTGTTGKLL